MPKLVILQAGAFYAYVAVAVACGALVGAAVNEAFSKKEGAK